MGLERIAAVLQGTHDNYDIDLFRTLIEAVAHETGVDPTAAQSASHKVIADHLRTTAFLIADGVLPSNEGRGYVLRRIMRRAMRHAHLLGAQEPDGLQAGADAGARDGRCLSRAGARAALDHRDAEARGRPLQEDAGHRPEAARRRDQGLRAPAARAEGRRRLQALRHFRLPARPDAGRPARARHQGRCRGLREGDGRAARQGARGMGRLRRDGRPGDLVRRAPEGRRDRVPGLRHRARRGPDQGDRDRRPRSRRRCRPARPAGSSSTRRRSMPSPAASSATPASSSAPAARRRSSTCRSGRRPACPSCDGRPRASSRSATTSP